MGIFWTVLPQAAILVKIPTARASAPGNTYAVTQSRRYKLLKSVFMGRAGLGRVSNTRIFFLKYNPRKNSLRSLLSIRLPTTKDADLRIV